MIEWDGKKLRPPPGSEAMIAENGVRLTNKAAAIFVAHTPFQGPAGARFGWEPTTRTLYLKPEHNSVTAARPMQIREDGNWFINQRFLRTHKVPHGTFPAAWDDEAAALRIDAGEKGA